MDDTFPCVSFVWLLCTFSQTGSGIYLWDTRGPHTSLGPGGVGPILQMCNGGSVSPAGTKERQLLSTSQWKSTPPFWCRSSLSYILRQDAVSARPEWLQLLFAVGASQGSQWPVLQKEVHAFPSDHLPTPTSTVSSLGASASVSPSSVLIHKKVQSECGGFVFSTVVLSC